MALHTFEIGGVQLTLIDAPVPQLPADAGVSEAEREIITLVVAGDSTADIAAKRGSSVRTVSNQLAQIYRKFGVLSRFELVALLTSEG